MRFITIAGSRLYGTNRDDSDYDYRGVYLESEEQILGLQVAKNIEQKEPVDCVIYPLRIFVRLALQNNPNILEILFARPQYWQTDTPEDMFFHPFLLAQHSFLSQRARNTYLGYAFSQLKAIESAKSPTKNTRLHLIEEFGYDTKYAAHTARLIEQGTDILIKGDFNPTLSGGALTNVVSILHGQWKKEEFIAWAQQRLHDLKTIKSDLPEHPDSERIERLLVRTYKERLWA